MLHFFNIMINSTVMSYPQNGKQIIALIKSYKTFKRTTTLLDWFFMCFEKICWGIFTISICYWILSYQSCHHQRIHFRPDTKTPNSLIVIPFSFRDDDGIYHLLRPKRLTPRIIDLRPHVYLEQIRFRPF